MKLIRVGLAVGYPFAIYAALRWGLEPRLVALALAVLLLGRLVARRRLREHLSPLLVPGLLVAGVVGMTLLSNDERFMLFVPALVSTALLVAFGRSLWRGPSLVESMARLEEPDLSPERAAYCRRLTGVWCAFFLANALLCLWLALSGDLEIWALYTGFGVYLVIGLIFAVELAVRARRFGAGGEGLASPFLRRFFPGDRVS